jgi:hypothetical protein
MSDEIDLSSLVGPHVIDGRADFVMPLTLEYGGHEDAHVFVLRLDGKLHWFQEDPGDGYRSGLDHVRICDPSELPPGSFSEFPPMNVDITAKTETVNDGYRAEHDLLIGTTASGSVLFEVGTCNIDDYYPSFVATWTPSA